MGERDCRWFARAFVLIQIAIAIEASSQVLWISRESIASILGIWLPGWLMVIFRVSSLCVYSLLLAGVVQITWPLKRYQRSVISWAACWGLFNVVFIWLVLILAHRVNDLIMFTSGREILISVWPGEILRWLVANGFPVLGLVAGYSGRSRSSFGSSLVLGGSVVPAVKSRSIRRERNAPSVVTTYVAILNPVVLNVDGAAGDRSDQSAAVGSAVRTIGVADDVRVKAVRTADPTAVPQRSSHRFLWDQLA